MLSKKLTEVSEVLASLLQPVPLTPQLVQTLLTGWLSGSWEWGGWIDGASGYILLLTLHTSSKISKYSLRYY